MQRFVSISFRILFFFQKRWCRGSCKSWNLSKRSEGRSKMDSTSGAPCVKESCSPGQNLTAKPVQISSEIKEKKSETEHRCCTDYATRKTSKIEPKFKLKKPRRPSGNVVRAHPICSCIFGRRDTDASTTCTAPVRTHLASLWAGKRQLRLAKPASVTYMHTT